MRIQGTLKRLAARSPSAWPVLSVYVNTRPVVPQMATYRPFFKKRMAEELKVYPSRSPEYESLAVDFGRVQHYLDYDLRDSTQAATLFASYADGDLFDAVQLSAPFPGNLVSVAPLPTLYPLIRMADRYRRTAVAVADSNTARLFVIALGAIELRREIRSPVVHKPRPSGDRDPAHSERPAEEAWAQHVRQAARALEDVAGEVRASHLIVGGEKAVLAELVRHLSKAASEKLLGQPAWDIRIPEPELVADVDRIVEAHEAGERRRRAKELIEASGSARGVLGLEPTLDALRQSRVAELVLSETFPDATAWVCRACRSFGAGAAAEACPYCGRAELECVELREEVGARAAAQDARVHFVESKAVPEFDAAGGIGALLRQS